MDIFDTLHSQPHVLIGGRTGAGKSVLLAGLVYTAMIADPADLRFVLIDPKRVELRRFAVSPHCIGYASEPPTMLAALQAVEKIMDRRYITMQETGLRNTVDPHIYVYIDELADLLDVCGKSAGKTLKRLLQLGRAAGVHVIAATQHVSRRTLPAAIQLNFTGVAALPQRSAIESRQMIGTAGAENLPVGYAYIITPQQHHPHVMQIPMIPEPELLAAVHMWDHNPTASTDETVGAWIIRKISELFR